MCGFCNAWVFVGLCFVMYDCVCVLVCVGFIMGDCVNVWVL